MRVYLCLFINTMPYHLEPFEEDGVRGWALMKPDGELYHCHMDKHGMSCTCGDSTFRGAKNGVPCKHLKALAELRLL